MEKLAWELAFYLPWVVVGWIFGSMPWLLLAATALQLFWHLNHQIRLSAWLWDEKRLTPPSERELGVAVQWHLSLAAAPS